MDFLILCFGYLFKIGLYIIVIGGAIVVLLLIYILFKLLQILNLVEEMIEDINQKYFLMENIISKPFKFLFSLFNKKGQ